MKDNYGVLPDNVIMSNIFLNIRHNLRKGIKKYKHITSTRLRPTLINDLKRIGYTVIEHNNKKGKYIYEIF